ncbi:MAG: indole-3-glycerol phosphate synthase TrpC, partial [Pseudomonadota bacterium]
MTNALTPILAYKKGEVDALKRSTTHSALLDRAHGQTPPRGFAASLSEAVDKGRNGLICELKRKSPSAGEILPGADPVEIASDYQAGGAACLSILTDGPSFGGSLDDLGRIRAKVSLPLLRKDFMIDPLQVIEARAYGADAILIIMAAVSDALAEDLEAT